MWVIPDLLRGAAQALNGAGAAIGGAATPATALPPAPDVASLAAIGRLNMYAIGLANALTEGSQRLTYLDGKLVSDAGNYESVDGANAQAIAQAGGLNGVGGNLVSTDGGTAPPPPAPAATSATSPGGMPEIPPLAVPGEAFAALLDTAPGSTSLSTYLSTLKGVASTLDFSNPLVDRGRGMVMEGWSSSDSGGANPAEAATAAIARMTEWGTEATSYTTALQNSAEEMASAFETLRASHPTTVEYTAANTQIQSGITGMQAGAASMNPVMFVAGAMNFQAGTAEKAALDARAVQTQSTYTARLQTATNVETPLPSVNASRGQVSGSSAPLGGGSGGSQTGYGSGSGSGAYSGGSGAGYGGSSGYGGGSTAAGQTGQAGQMGQTAGQAGSGYTPQSAGNGMSGGDGYLNGSGTSGYDDGSGFGSGSAGFAPYAPGGMSGFAGGGGGSGGGNVSSAMNNVGRLAGQSVMAVPESTAGSGLNSQASKIGAVPGAATGRGMGMGPMMPPMGRGIGGDGDKDKERDKGLSPDIKVEDDTEYGPAVLGVRPRIAPTRLPKAEA